ncbi:hypothetical protein R3P38DRAFT_3516053 [Favolaschia claudopus]|uniref:Uncharacterized protein n=1 Tax=Favolaschia claudopus TaxID=2862362 RepID=A0AAW0BSA9_9AGAR
MQPAHLLLGIYNRQRASRGRCRRYGVRQLQLSYLHAEGGSGRGGGSGDDDGDGGSGSEAGAGVVVVIAESQISQTRILDRVAKYSHLLTTIWGDRALDDPEFIAWVMSRATDICVKEASRITDTSRRRKFHAEAQSLRLTCKSIKIQHLQSFSVPGLLQLYERTTPHLQSLLQAIIGKKAPDSEEELSQIRVRNPDMSGNQFAPSYQLCSHAS